MTKNTTKRVSADTLEGKDPLAVGYKIFEHDWGAQGGYHYADRDGDAAGSVHTVTGALKKCNWGLHFCKNPLDCIKYQMLTQKERDKLKDAAGKAETGAAEKIAAAEREAERVRQELENAKKRLAASDRDVTEFSVWFKAVQTDLGALSGCMEKIKGRDAAMAAKLAAALKTMLSPYVGGTA